MSYPLHFKRPNFGKRSTTYKPNWPKVNERQSMNELLRPLSS